MGKTDWNFPEKRLYCADRSMIQPSPGSRSLLAGAGYRSHDSARDKRRSDCVEEAPIDKAQGNPVWGICSPKRNLLRVEVWMGVVLCTSWADIMLHVRGAARRGGARWSCPFMVLQSEIHRAALSYHWWTCTELKWCYRQVHTSTYKYKVQYRYKYNRGIYSG